MPFYREDRGQYIVHVQTYMIVHLLYKAPPTSLDELPSLDALKADIAHYAGLRSSLAETS